MNSYVYHPANRSNSFLDGMQALSKKGYTVTREVPAGAGVDSIIKQMAIHGLTMSTFAIDITEYKSYFDKAGYLSKYPRYYPSNLQQKVIEHYIALKMLAPQASDVLIDIASENSPLAEICTRLYGTRAYSQDIMYPAGIHGSRIGGDACSMPVESGFATKAVLTCSLEHFEQDADKRLFIELYRVLKPGGIVCVIPFYLSATPFTMTDPVISGPNNVIFDEGAPVYCCEGWGNRHGRHYSPDTFSARIAEQVKGKFSFNFYHIVNSREVFTSSYAKFAFTATRTE